VIGRDPHQFRSDAASFGDHTTGDGNMLIANGSSSLGAVVWRETVDVVPGRVYAFRGWGASWGATGGSDLDPARIQLYINGVAVGGEFRPVSQVGLWSNFERIWSSGNAVRATLTLVDLNRAFDYNDFVLDDFSFTGDGQSLLADGSDFARQYGSDYPFSNDTRPEGNHTVGINPLYHHSGAASFVDHTTGYGCMLIANGATQPDQIVWQQSVATQSGALYRFSLWAASWGNSGGIDPNPARLRVFVNGTHIGSDFTLRSQDGKWAQLVIPWSSTGATSAVIQIVDANTEGNGNDFAIDDIALMPYHPADHSGDGISDLVLQNQTDRRIALLTMGRTSVWSSSALTPTLPDNWRVACAGDFDGDGYNELVVQNTQTRAISILFLSGIQIRSSVPVNPLLPAGWKLVAAGDVSGDGKPDLIVQNTTTQQIAALLMAGVAIDRSRSFSRSLAAGWEVVGVGDFAGDDQVDLVVQNPTSRQVSVLTLSGQTITGSMSLLPALPANWAVAAIGDYTGDGKSELVAQSGSTGQISILVIESGRIAASLPIHPAPPAGWKLVGPR
jgi:hypothetical protein